MITTARPRRARAALALSALALASAHAPAQPCEPAWLPGASAIGTGGKVLAFTEWDPDGPGPAPPALIAGGEFSSAGGAPFSFRVARWDGAAWHALGTGLRTTVTALAAWDPDGPGPAHELLVAGSSNGDIDLWDGSTWTPLGAGASDEISALTSWDPDGPGPLLPRLVIGGIFHRVDEVQVDGLAQWNGVAWSRIASGRPGEIVALRSFDHDGPGPLAPRLIVAGDFWIFDTGVSARNIAAWDGSAWSAVGNGLPSRAGGMTIADLDGPGPQRESLIAAFTSGAMVWNGSQWTLLGTGPSGFTRVRGVAAYDPDGPGPGQGHVVLAGWNWPVGQPARCATALWDGAAWTTHAPIDGLMMAAGAWDPDGDGPGGGQALVGGTFDRAGPVPYNNIAIVNGASLDPIGDGFDRALIGVTAWDADGPGPEPEILAAVGSIAGIGRLPVNGVALWDGWAWSSAGEGLGPYTVDEWSPAYAITPWDPDGPGPAPSLLIAGGRFTLSGSNPVLRIASWNGQAWTQMGAGFNNIVYEVTTWDTDGLGPLPPTLIAAGEFTKSGTESIDSLARWDGEAWRRLAFSINGPVDAITTWDPDGDGPLAPLLVAAGDFTIIDQTAANAIVTWDGLDWRPLGAGLDNVYEVHVHDFDGDGPLPPRLIASGSFSNRIRIWDGAAWSRFDAGLNTSSSGSVSDFLTFDPDPLDAEPPLLLASGFFSAEDTGAQHGLIAWTGSRWEPFGGDPVGGIRAMAGFNAPGSARPQLAVVGTFTWIADTPSSFVALRGCPESACPADLNGDGVIDFADYLEFLNLYDALDLRADFNADGVVDFADYLEFLNHFDAGC